MRQICTSRKVWLPILLLFTAVFIFACWDRGVSIDFDGTGLYLASPLDSAIEAVPVSFHGQLRKNVYTGSCDIPGVLQCDDLCVVFRGDESTDVYCRDQAYSEPTPIHSITLDRTQRYAEIRLWSEYTVEGDRVPQTWVERRPDRRFLQVNSKPLTVPHEVNSWYVAKVL